jgi:hypothetical protein
MFEEMVLREEVIAGWWKLHNEKLHYLQTDDDIKIDAMGGACSTHLKDEVWAPDFGRKHEGRIYSEHLGVEKGIILKLILK